MKKELKQFVEKVLNMDEEATFKFYKMLKEIVGHVCSGWNISKEEQEDMVHDLYVKLVLDKKLKQFKGHAKLSTWLFIITLRERFNRTKKQKKIQNLHANTPENIGLTLISELDPSLSALYEAVEKLDGIEREIIKLYLLGFKLKEISELLNIPVKKIYKKFEKAKKHLRKFLLGKNTN